MVIEVENLHRHQEVLEIIIVDTKENTGSIGIVVGIGVTKAEEEKEVAMNVDIMEIAIET